ncbi:MAG: tetratricopeptide repeat protein [Candidatus Atribacteria bacterium]|nr:MAG: tetratricopeptide repeat protein [Candidatus Atribacteria bacterium]
MSSMTIKSTLLIILAVAVIILFFILVFQKKKRNKSYRSKYIDALYALIDGRKDDALILLTQAVKNGETDIDAYIQLGNLFREKKMPEKALQIHRALTVRRNLSYSEEKSIQISMAEDLADMGKIDRAVLALSTINKRKKDPEILMALHRLYHRCGDYDNAYQIMKNLSSIDKNIRGEEKSAYLSSVASACLQDGKPEMAMKYLEKALKEFDTSIPAIYLLARQTMEKKEFKKASRLWYELIKIDRSLFAEVLPFLEKSLFESGNFVGLEEILEELYKNYGGDSEIAISLASLYMKKGMFEESINILEDEKKNGQSEPSVYLMLSLAFFDSGRTNEAHKVLGEFTIDSLNTNVRKCDSCGEEYDFPFRYCTKYFSFNGPA